ncbi:hypothetical protein [Virgisporangium aurantiacum]|nr:hypothetical protein [Virgisporangium aurantiacum]
MLADDDAEPPPAHPPTDWPELPPSLTDLRVTDTQSMSAAGDESNPSAERHVRLPGYLVPVGQDSPAEGLLTHDMTPDDIPAGADKIAIRAGDDGEAAQDPVSAWAYLPTDPQPVVTPPAEASPPTRRRTLLTAIFIGVGLIAIVVVAASSLLPMLRSPQDKGTGANGPAGPEGVAGPAISSPYAVSGPVGDIRTAEFQLVAGVTAVLVRTTDIGGDLYRVATPEGSGFAPRVDQEGAQVRLRLARLYDTDSSDQVTVELNPRVQWRINLLAGSESATVDMRAADLAGVDFVGGVGSIEMWLPVPHGDVAVRMSGGVRDFIIHAPGNIPVQATLVRGAGAVTVDEATRSGVAAGTRVTQDGWNDSQDRYDIDAVAGLGVLTVDRY